MMNTKSHLTGTYRVVKIAGETDDTFFNNVKDGDYITFTFGQLGCSRSHPYAKSVLIENVRTGEKDIETIESG